MYSTDTHPDMKDQIRHMTRNIEVTIQHNETTSCGLEGLKIEK